MFEVKKKNVKEDVKEMIFELECRYNIEPEQAIRFEKDVLGVFCYGLEIGKLINNKA